MRLRVVAISGLSPPHPTPYPLSNSPPHSEGEDLKKRPSPYQGEDKTGRRHARTGLSSSTSRSVIPASILSIWYNSPFAFQAEGGVPEETQSPACPRSP